MARFKVGHNTFYHGSQGYLSTLTYLNHCFAAWAQLPWSLVLGCRSSFQNSTKFCSFVRSLPFSVPLDCRLQNTESTREKISNGGHNSNPTVLKFFWGIQLFQFTLSDQSFKRTRHPQSSCNLINLKPKYFFHPNGSPSEIFAVWTRHC